MILDRFGLTGKRAQRLLFAAELLPPLACLCCLPLFHSWAGRRFQLFYFAPIISMASLWCGLRVERLEALSRSDWALDGGVFLAALGLMRLVLAEKNPLAVSSAHV